MTAALVAFAVVLALSIFGIRIGFATLFVGFFGFALERVFGPAITLTGSQVMENATNYNLSVVPLFILMGIFIYRADISGDLYKAAHARLGHLRGGLAQSTVLACAAFSAVCGSSLATAATMTRVALPPMRRYNYSDRLAAGTIAAGGTLGIMIPPSVPLVIYGIIAEQDIGQLFMAGVVPGLLLVVAFMITVAIWTQLQPDVGPPGERLPEDERKGALRAVLPVLLLFLLVLGGIYGGVFTPTEAAGIGAVGAALIAFFRGYMRTLDEWRSVLSEAVVTTSALFMVVFGTLVFSQYINLTGMPFDLMFLVQDLNLSPLGLVVAIAVIAMLLGMIFESLGILLLIVPVFLPALITAQVDLIWFGIIVVQMTELIQRGVVDGFVGIPATDAQAFNVLPSAQSVTQTTQKILTPTFSFFISDTKWAEIDPADQEAIRALSGEAFAERLGGLYTDREEQVHAQIAETIPVVVASEEFEADLRALSQQWIDDWVAEASAIGIDGEAALTFYTSEIERLSE